MGPTWKPERVWGQIGSVSETGTARGEIGSGLETGTGLESAWVQCEAAGEDKFCFKAEQTG